MFLDFELSMERIVISKMTILALTAVEENFSQVGMLAGD